MLSERKPKHSKPAGRLIPANDGSIRLVLALWMTAGVIVFALGANARNGLLHGSAVKAASDRLERKIHQSDPPSTSQMSDKLAGLPPEASPQLTLTPNFSGPRNYQWDAENRLIEIDYSGSGNNTKISYDGLGHWVKIVETAGGIVTGTKQFLWAGEQPCEERDGTGAVTKRFFNGGEQIAGTTYFYTIDHLGSVREMTDGTGNTVAQYSYEPFGRTTKVQGSLDSDFQYAGMYRHAPSGLYFAVHRVYNPVLGRWLNRDPMDDPMFARMPLSPEPEDPSALTLASAFAQPGAPQNPNVQAIQSTSSDQILQAQLAKSIPSTHYPGHMATNDSYVYAENNPISYNDLSGLGIGRPHPNPKDPDPVVCPNDLHDQCVKQCKRAFAGFPKAIAWCIWNYCRKYL